MSPIEASFSTLVLSIAHSAKVAMGEVEHPETKNQKQDISMARFNIDLLSVLQKKTKDNLEDTERKLLEAILGDLQMKFIKITSSDGKTP